MNFKEREQLRAVATDELQKGNVAEYERLMKVARNANPKSQPEVTKWSVEEEEYLIKHYGKTTLPVICKRLDKTKASVLSKVRNLRIKGRMDKLTTRFKSKSNVWRKEQDDFVVANFGEMTIEAIGEQLSKTKSEVAYRIRVLRAKGIIPKFKKKSELIREHDLSKN